MKTRVILESPFAGDEAAHVDYARECVAHSLSLGEAPIASHLLYTQPGILDDDKPDERRLGIDAGLAWVQVADASVFYVDMGFSEGMRHGKDVAECAGLPIVLRSIRQGKTAAASGAGVCNVQITGSLAGLSLEQVVSKRDACADVIKRNFMPGGWVRSVSRCHDECEKEISARLMANAGGVGM